jgi:putative DNA primase/helicase
MLSPIAENIPEALKERPQWVCWRVVHKRNKKPTKVPHVPGTVNKASSTDLMTWRTFEEALAAYEAGEPPYDGIGFVFCSADPFVGIDLDECIDPQTSEVVSWAQEIIDRMHGAYLELSPTATGIHVITQAVLKTGTKRKHIEVYGQDRFFTITGRSLC